jgi:hypothetical protein
MVFGVFALFDSVGILGKARLYLFRFEVVDFSNKLLSKIYFGFRNEVLGLS